MFKTSAGLIKIMKITVLGGFNPRNPPLNTGLVLGYESLRPWE